MKNQLVFVGMVHVRGYGTCTFFQERKALEKMYLRMRINTAGHLAFRLVLHGCRASRHGVLQMLGSRRRLT